MLLTNDEQPIQALAADGADPERSAKASRGASGTGSARSAPAARRRRHRTPAGTCRRGRNEESGPVAGGRSAVSRRPRRPRHPGPPAGPGVSWPAAGARAARAAGRRHGSGGVGRPGTGPGMGAAVSTTRRCHLRRASREHPAHQGRLPGDEGRGHRGAAAPGAVPPPGTAERIPSPGPPGGHRGAAGAEGGQGVARRAGGDGEQAALALGRR